jgi:predicted NUDIX family NTP pyrophosphohydrolase
MKQSAGIVFYRYHHKVLQVLLVHPGGPFWARKDAGAWTIPKGEPNEDEDLLLAAKREFAEETGFGIEGDFIKLTPVKQKGGKLVHAWAVEGDMDVTLLKSNTFEMPWPPGSTKMQVFPEIDRAEWFTVEEAIEKILPAQAAFIEELKLLLTRKD